jgi:broad specificity phosphatase PhoE
LIRHGQTDRNRERRYQGHTDVPLNEVGRRQAQRLATRLAGTALHTIYTSDLSRAAETARIVGDRTNVSVLSLRGLREIDVGTATGLTRVELRQRHPELFGDDWVSAGFPGGESYGEMSARVYGTVRDLIAVHADQAIGIVSHGGAIRALVAELVGIPLTSLIGMVVANTSVTRIQIQPTHRPRLHSLNDAAHLESWTNLILDTS